MQAFIRSLSVNQAFIHFVLVRPQTELLNELWSDTGLLKKDRQKDCNIGTKDFGLVVRASIHRSQANARDSLGLCSVAYGQSNGRTYKVIFRYAREYVRQRGVKQGVHFVAAIHNSIA